MSKTLNSKIQNKIDTFTNWNDIAKGPDIGANFVPLKGEIVIYLPDNNSDFTTPKMKVGDGVTRVFDLPYVVTDEAEIDPDLTPVAVPTVSGTYTYNGSIQYVSWVGYDSSKMTISNGPTSAINAGVYPVQFSLLDGYCWIDGSTNSKTVSWTIQKANSFIKADTTSITVDQSISDYYLQLHVHCNPSEGHLVTQYDSSLLTVYDSGDVTGEMFPDEGFDALNRYEVSFSREFTFDTTLTITLVGNSNYNDFEIKIPISVGAAKSLNDYTWEEISAISAAGDGPNTFNIGDTKKIVLNGSINGALELNNYETYVYIIDFNHQNGAYGGVINGIQFGTFKTALKNGIDVCLVDNYYGAESSPGQPCFCMYEDADDNDGWGHSYMRNRILSDLMDAMPSDLRSVLQPMTIWTSEDVQWPEAVESTDYLALFAEKELTGRDGASGSSAMYAPAEEREYQTQYAYYANGNSKVKKQHNNTGTTGYYWTRSIQCEQWNGNFGEFLVCLGSLCGNRSSEGSFGIAPFFTV